MDYCADSSKDKVQPEARGTAHTKFQEIAFAYAILSDERRRKRYDTTGNTSESLDIDGDDFSWSDFFRAQWADAVTAQKLNNFKDTYQNSDEERHDVLAAYRSSKGKLNQVFKTVMLSNPLDDEERFRSYIDQAIKDGELEAYDTYMKETQKSKDQRHVNARKEGAEAENHAKKLGVYESLFGDGDAKSGKRCCKKDGGQGLAEMIQQRQQGRAATFLDDLEAKYAGGKRGAAKSRNGEKRKVEEPPEDAFQKNRQKKRKAAKAKENLDEEEEEDLNSNSPRSWTEDDPRTWLEDDEVDAKPAESKINGTKGRKKASARKRQKVS